MTLAATAGISAADFGVASAIPATTTLGTLSPTAWTVNTPGYSGTITVSGGTGPYTLAGQTGLPTGLTAVLSGSTISFTGVPTATGTFSSVNLTVQDSDAVNTAQGYSITINAAPSLGTLSPTAWTVNTPGYSGTITVSGGTGPYTLTGQTGLPTGLTAVLSGSTISFTGTPTTTGTFSSVNLTVKDSTGSTVAQGYSITINAAPSLGTLSPTAWTVNTPGYSGTITVSGGTGPYTLTGQTGLPTGLTAVLSGSTISFTGTPTTTGTFSSVNLTVKDSTGATVAQSYSITINAAPTLGTLSPTAWTVNTPGYSGTITVSGGTGPYTLTGQTGLPTGLTAVLSGSTISFTGTPTTTGTFSSVNLTVKDSTGATVAQSYSITINAAPTLGTLSPTAWTVNTPGYSGTITVSGGTGPYTLTGQTGLPTGLTAVLSGSTISFTGTPTTTGTFSSVNLTVKDSTGSTVAQGYSITINAALPTLTVTAPSPSMAFGNPVPTLTPGYSGFVNGQGPNSLTTKPTCTTTAVFDSPAGTYPVMCSGGVDADYSFDYVAGTLTVLPHIAAVGVALGQPLGALTDGCQSFSLTFSTGVSGATFSVSAGSLPPGLTLSPSGSLTGTPTTPGRYSFTLSSQVGAVTLQTSFIVTIGLCIEPGHASLPAGHKGTPYSAQVTASGGTPGYRFQLQGGALPPGLTMARDGTISGNPYVPGTYSVTMMVLDSANPVNEGERTLTITVS